MYSHSGLEPFLPDFVVVWIMVNITSLTKCLVYFLLFLLLDSKHRPGSPK